MWEKIVEFFKYYDINHLVAALRTVDWHALATNPICIGLVLGVFCFAIYKRQIKLLVGVLSFVAFILLVLMVTPRGNEYVPREKVFMFIGGGIGLAILNLYMIFFHD